MMQSPESLGTGVALVERLPLRWQAWAGSPDEAARQRQANEETLRVILSLDEHPHGELTDEDPALAQELARLESKLNLVLELVGQLLVRQLVLPPPVAVQLHADSLKWETATPPPAGARLLIELYPCNRFPRPLALPAVARPESRAGWAAAGFEELGEAVQDQLEMLIFRHHRRRVAAARRSNL
jgi:hypothetical protein